MSTLFFIFSHFILSHFDNNENVDGLLVVCQFSCLFIVLITVGMALPYVGSRVRRFVKCTTLRKPSGA